jgi:hypothetical protein
MRPLMEFWSARRILRNLCDGPTRQAVLTAFWKGADAHAQARALVELSKVLHFRPDSLRKAPVSRKAELLGSRLPAADFEETFEHALMVYHTREKKEMLAAFLDRWNIPHQDGSIEAEEYTPPSRADVESAVQALEEQFGRRSIAIYLASAGLLMGAIPEWREATWPVVASMGADLE